MSRTNPKHAPEPESKHANANANAQDRTLHTELALTCVDEVLVHLRDDAVYKLWRAKGASFSRS